MTNVIEINDCFSRLTKANPEVNYISLTKDGKIIRASNPASIDINAIEFILTKWRNGFKNLTFLKIRTKECEYFVLPDFEYIAVAYTNITNH